MARRSELVALTVDDVRWHADGAASVRVRRTKTDDSGRGRVGHLAPFAAEALKKWLELAGIEQGPLFRRILPNEALGTEVLERKKVARSVKRMLGKISPPAKEVARPPGAQRGARPGQPRLRRARDHAGRRLGVTDDAGTRELLAARNAMAQMLGRGRGRRQTRRRGAP
jgi:integrase